MNIELSSVICMYQFKFEYIYDVIKEKKKKTTLSRRHFYDVSSTCANRRCTDVGFRSPTSRPSYNQY